LANLPAKSSYVLGSIWEYVSVCGPAPNIEELPPVLDINYIVGGYRGLSAYSAYFCRFGWDQSDAGIGCCFSKVETGLKGEISECALGINPKIFSGSITTILPDRTKLPIILPLVRNP
jgi:hypothetical protein